MQYTDMSWYYFCIFKGYICIILPPINRFWQKISHCIMMFFSVPVHGGWTRWESYESCSRTCGGGMKYRSRSCSNPPPRYGGNDCEGLSSETLPCNQQICQGIIFSLSRLHMHQRCYKSHVNI